LKCNSSPKPSPPHTTEVLGSYACSKVWNGTTSIVWYQTEACEVYVCADPLLLPYLKTIDTFGTKRRRSTFCCFPAVGQTT
jgi:hypothetical protein